MFVTVRQKTEYNSAKEASYGRLFLLAFAEHRAAALWSLAPEARDQGRQVREQERHEGEQEDGQRERPGHEDREVSLAYGERPPELRLHQRAQDHTEYYRPHREVVPAHEEAQDTYGVHHQEVDGAVREAVDTERGEDEDAGVEEGFWDLQQLHPDPDERQVQDQQHHVADVETSYQSPYEVRGVLEEQRARLQVED